MSGIEKKLVEAEQKLENLQKQLAVAQEEVKKPFAREAELAEKSARLAELNAMLNMDEHNSSDVLGVDEETDVDAIEPLSTERASDARPCSISYGERASQSAEKPSLLGRLHSKQAIVNEAKGNNTPEKKHEQSL